MILLFSGQFDEVLVTMDRVKASELSSGQTAVLQEDFIFGPWLQSTGSCGVGFSVPRIAAGAS